MKKLLLAALVALIVLAGCASTDSAESAADPNAMPEWVMSDQSTQDVHYAVGYAKQATQMNSIKRAQAEARTLLAEWVNIAVDEIITTYTNDAGSGENRQAVDAFETIAKQRAQAVLSGSTQEAFWVDADGGVYVLMGIPVENVKDQMYGAVTESARQAGFEKNEAAAEANAMMNAAIDRFFSSPSVTE